MICESVRLILLIRLGLRAYAAGIELVLMFWELLYGIA